jgi:ParB/RepB/Spo0J family partition protein
MTAIEMIAVGKLRLADDNIRQETGDVAELAASMKSVGVLEPLLVTDDGLVVAGSRRLAAAKKARLKEVPAIRRAYSDQERLEVMIVENLQREDLSPLEEADGFRRLIELGLNQRDVAAKVGCSQTHIARRVALLALPAKVQSQVAEGKVSFADAHELGKVKNDPKLVEKLAKSAADGGMRSVSSQVQEELASRERAKELAAVVAKLEKKGEKVVEVKSDTYGYNTSLPAGHARVLGETYSTSDVRMDPKKHAKLDCHAVAVNPRTMAVVEVCTDPKQHPSRKDEMAAQQKKAEAKRAKEAEAYDAMTERRRDFLRSEIKGRVNKEALLELCLLALTTDPSYYGDRDTDELACGLLGIELDPHLDDAVSDPAYEALREKIASDKLRALYAIAAARMEADLSPFGHWDRAYFGWLEARGYQPSKDEQERIDDKDVEPFEQVKGVTPANGDAATEEAA